MVGLNLALLVCTDQQSIDLGRPTDRDLSEVVHILFPRTPYVDVGQVALDEAAFPGRGSLSVGTFEGGLLLGTQDAHLYNPTKLASRYLKPSLGSKVTLLTQRPLNDMFAYGRWERGQLIRSISVNPVGRVWESIGTPEPFESPFWAGQRAAAPNYPLPFHPLDMGDAALRDVLRLHVEGLPEPGLIDISSVLLHRFERSART